jgi:hypothetical protein
MTFQSLPGFRDFFPAEFSARQHIIAAWRETARRYGFEEYDGPPLEPLELYVEKSGEEIVEPALQLPGQGRAGGGAAPGDDAYTGPDGGRARAGAAQADPLVQRAAAVPLRARAAGPAAGAFPVERGHRG